MRDSVSLEGTVTSIPDVQDENTSFYIDCALGQLRVIRTELYWQKRDIVFIRIGQTICVTGDVDVSQKKIYASQIIIVAHTDIIQEQENEYDTETI